MTNQQGEESYYERVAVNGMGVSAYLNNGADARQLWVKVDDKVAFVVAFGDLPNEEGDRETRCCRDQVGNGWIRLR